MHVRATESLAPVPAWVTMGYAMYSVGACAVPDSPNAVAGEIELGGLPSVSSCPGLVWFVSRQFSPVRGCAEIRVNLELRRRKPGKGKERIEILLKVKG